MLLPHGVQLAAHDGAIGFHVPPTRKRDHPAVVHDAPIRFGSDSFAPATMVDDCLLNLLVALFVFLMTSILAFPEHALSMQNVSLRPKRTSIDLQSHQRAAAVIRKADVGRGRCPCDQKN